MKKLILILMVGSLFANDELSKKDVFDLFLCNHRECKKLRKSAPRPIYFLSNKSQRHLKKTLEYLESMKIDYDIDDL